MSASLSFSAEQLLGAVERRVLGEAPPAKWLLALVEQDRALVEAGAGDPGLDALLAYARAEPHGVPLTRAEITERATTRAADEDRSVAGSADVVAAVLAAVGATPAIESPEMPAADAEEDTAEEPALVEQARETEAPAAERGTATAPRTAAMSGRPRIFRVFVSSTFKDLEAERNILQMQVYPHLSAFCAERGARFQPIDLRWGVSEEASLDQQAMDICLGEIERCREVTPRPNFLILLGNRYGWLALPPQMPESEFDEICDRVSDRDDSELLEAWYQLDQNAVPTAYRLRPRTIEWAPAGHVPPEDFGDEEQRKDEELRRWGVAERRLHAILTAAVEGLELSEERRRVYQASATEQEIRAGALDIGAPEGRAFCFIREIALTDDDPDPVAADRDPRIATFVDPDQVGPLDGRHGLLSNLKRELAGRLPVKRYGLGGDIGVASSREINSPTADHLQQLADDVRTTLEAAIEDELANPLEPPADQVEIRIRPDDALDEEGRAHREFADERIRYFVGRWQILQSADDYLSGTQPFPLVLHGGGGTGKSALLAEIVRRAQDRPSVQLVYRFIGATPGSADGRGLLEGICRELARRYSTDESDVPKDFQELSSDFKERLGSATAERPLLLFIDSLDQLAAGDGARRLTWIPDRLPEHVRLVVSTRPGETLEPLERRLTALDPHGGLLLEVGAMDRAEGGELLRQWLAAAHRTLTGDQRRRVLDAFESADGNPLYLRLAFEEARRWISAQDPEDLAVGNGDDEHRRTAVEAIIEHNTFARLAKEDNHGEVVVSHALGYLAASRYGLAEDELLDLLYRDPDVYASFVLGSYHVSLDLRERLEHHLSDTTRRELHHRARERAAERGEQTALLDDLQPVDEVAEWLRQIRDGERSDAELKEFLDETLALPREQGLRLPVVLWSRLYADLRPYLTERTSEGAVLIAFYHRELDDVAEAVYLRGPDGLTLHSRLADYFRARANPRNDHTWTTDGEHVDRRGLSELPYHLTNAERWDDIHDTLTDFVFLEQKAQHVDVMTQGEGGEATTIYRGVYQLQDDFDTALRLMPGGTGDTSDRRRIIVTAVDFGEGLVIRCPHCNRMIPWKEEYRDQAMPCPLTDPDCGGPLKVNPFVVERSAS